MDSSVQTITAILTALGAFIGALVLAYRGLSGDRFTRKVNESAALLAGYTDMVKNLRIEISDMRLDHDKETQRNKQQYQGDLERLGRLHKAELDSVMAIYAEERKLWDVERERLSNKISELDEALSKVKTEVYLLMHPPVEPPERKG